MPANKQQTRQNTNKIYSVLSNCGPSSLMMFVYQGTNSIRNHAITILDHVSEQNEHKYQHFVEKNFILVLNWFELNDLIFNRRPCSHYSMCTWIMTKKILMGQNNVLVLIIRSMSLHGKRIAKRHSKWS